MKIYYHFIWILVLLFGFKEPISSERDYTVQVCTKDCLSLGMGYVNKRGFARVVKNYQAQKVRASEIITSRYIDIPGYKGYMGRGDKVFENGGLLAVPALDAVDDKITSVNFKVKGSAFACHIVKLVDPMEVVQN